MGFSMALVELRIANIALRCLLTRFNNGILKYMEFDRVYKALTVRLFTKV